MVGETTITYKGTELDIQYEFVKGKGFISRDVPPDEDDLNILHIETANGCEVPFAIDDIGIRWDIEMMVMEKIRD